MNSIHISTVFIVALCGLVSSQAVYPKYGAICFNSIDEIEQKLLQDLRREIHTAIERARKSLINEIRHTRDEMNSTWKNAMNAVHDRFIDHEIIQLNMASTINELKIFQNNTDNELNQISKNYRSIQDNVTRLNQSLTHETINLDTELQEARNAIENLDLDRQFQHRNITTDLKGIRDLFTDFDSFRGNVTTSLHNLDLLQNNTDNEIKQLTKNYGVIQDDVTQLNQSLTFETTNLDTELQEARNAIENLDLDRQLQHWNITTDLKGIRDLLFDFDSFRGNVTTSLRNMDLSQNNVDNEIKQLTKNYRVFKNDVTRLNQSLTHETTNLGTELQEARNAIENLDLDRQFQHRNISSDLKGIRDWLTDFGSFRVNVTTSLRNMDLLQKNTGNEIKQLTNTYKRIDTDVRELNHSLVQGINSVKFKIEDTKEFVKIVNISMERHLANINDTLIEVQYKADAIELKMTNQAKEVDGIQVTIGQLSGNYTLIEKELFSLPSMKSQILGLTDAKNRLDKQVSSYGSLSGKITTAQNKANSAYNFAKGIGVSCRWTGYLNNFDQVVNYIVPAGFAIRGTYSYHVNYAEDRRFQFYICK